MQRNAQGEIQVEHVKAYSLHRLLNIGLVFDRMQTFCRLNYNRQQKVNGRWIVRF